MSLEPGQVEVRHCATCGADTPHARLVARTWVYRLVLVVLGVVVPAVLPRSPSAAVVSLVALVLVFKPWRALSIPSLCQRCRFRGFLAKRRRQTVPTEVCL